MINMNIQKLIVIIIALIIISMSIFTFSPYVIGIFHSVSQANSSQIPAENETTQESEQTIVQTAVCKGNARCFDGIITKIVDGDTLEIDNIPIRLALVDAPEYNEEGGAEAKEFVSSLCPVGSTAKVDEDDGQTEGSYGRIIAAIYCNKITLNAELITNEFATIYKEFYDVSEFSNEYWAKDYGC